MIKIRYFSKYPIKSKEKFIVFRAFCEGTPVREFQRKKCFSLEFHSLNRTFVCEIY